MERPEPGGLAPGQPTVDCKGAPYDSRIPKSVMDGASKDIKYPTSSSGRTRPSTTSSATCRASTAIPSSSCLRGTWRPSGATCASSPRPSRTWTTTIRTPSNRSRVTRGPSSRRTTDYAERRWLDIWGRAEIPILPTSPASPTTPPRSRGRSSRGSRTPGSTSTTWESSWEASYLDPAWPGSSSSTVPDTKGAATWPPSPASTARTRIQQALHLRWLANDHTFGYAAGYPNPAVMIATNDEGRACSSTASAIRPVAERAHRRHRGRPEHRRRPRRSAPLDLAVREPLVKRGYVSHGHYDVASLHKLFAHVLGKPYRNASIANAALPLDLFTSTPDYTPYTYVLAATATSPATRWGPSRRWPHRSGISVSRTTSRGWGGRCGRGSRSFRRARPDRGPQPARG